LVKAGHELYVHNLRPALQGLLDHGARDCRSGREVAEQVEVIITMVTDTPHVEAAAFGPGGVAEGLKPGRFVVDMSLIAPLEIKKFAARVNESGL
jgi:2-hydroxy-3-oxopropionate reductase